MRREHKYPDGFAGNGDNGLHNPFDLQDTNLYGAGGAGHHGIVIIYGKTY